MFFFFRGCLHDSQIRDCKVLITKISSSGIVSSLYIRSWSSEAAAFTSFSGDFAAYCSKTTINFKLTQALLHFIASIAVNTIKPQIRFISDHFLGFTIFNKHVNVQGTDYAHIITKCLYLYCSMQLGYNRTPLQFLLLAMSRVELQYFISASSSQPLILLKKKKSPKKSL